MNKPVKPINRLEHLFPPERTPGTGKVKVNGGIKAGQLRVLGEDGNQLGVMSRRQALALAKRLKLDLVEIAPNANPPVCRICKWAA